MNVAVRYLAQLRPLAGRTEECVELADDSTVADLMRQLAARDRRLGAALLDDPAVCELVASRGVTIEACPTSNVHTGVIDAVEQHPLGRWLELGVRACVCTDNTYFSNVTAPEEHERVATARGMDRDKLARAIAFGHAARFVRA